MKKPRIYYVVRVWGGKENIYFSDVKKERFKICRTKRQLYRLCRFLQNKFPDYEVNFDFVFWRFSNKENKFLPYTKLFTWRKNDTN